MQSSVESITGKKGSYYDKASDNVIIKEESSAKVFTAGGALVKSSENSSSSNMKNLPSGAYIIKIATGETLKVVK